MTVEADEKLIERLMAVTHDHMSCCEPWLVNPDGPEAAAEITRLRARPPIDAEMMRRGVVAFRMDACSIERDVVLAELTDDEIESLVHAVLAVAAMQAQ